MAKRAVLVLLILWCCFGAYRLATQGEGPAASDLMDDPPTVEEANAGSPAQLAARGRIASAPAGRGSVRKYTPKPLPAWLASQVGVLDGPDRARFVAWLKADPTRIVDFVLRDAAYRQPMDSRSPLDFAQSVAEALGTDPRGLEFVVPVLLAQLRVEGRTGAEVASLLGALNALVPVLGDLGHEPVVALVREAHWPDGLRSLAVLLCLQFHSLSDAEAVRVLSTIQMSDMRNRREFGELIDVLKRRGPSARAFLPALLALYKRTFRIWWARGKVLDALLAVAPDDSRVLDAAARALGSNGHPRSVARAFLLEGGEARRQLLIEHLLNASGPARVHGVAALLELGVPAREISHLLLPALSDKSHLVRTKAVGLLALSGLQTSEVLPAINELLGSKKEERWLTATQALGALSRMEGDRRPVVDLLFAAVRIPSVRVRVTAVQTLLMFGGENKRIIPLLADLMDDTEIDVRCEALDGLGELSAHDATARRHLEAALGDSDERVREIAKYWLAEEDGSDDDD